MTTERKATLTIDGQAPVDFQIMSPTHGNDCIDIRTWVQNRFVHL
jgi:citrate synthase